MTSGADYNVAEKLCSDCQAIKPHSEFYKNKTRKDGHQNCCKACLKERMQNWYVENAESVRTKTAEYRRENLEIYSKAQAEYRERNPHVAREQTLRSYGLTLEDYERMFDEQLGLCKICGEEETNPKRSLAVDHDHDTGEVRGLLCGKCNSGIGLLRDSSELLACAYLYLIGEL